MADNSTSSLPFTERQSNRGTNLQFGIVHSVPISHNVPVARLKSSQKSHRSPQQRAPTAATLRSRTPPSLMRTPNKAASAAHSHPAKLRFSPRTNALRLGLSTPWHVAPAEYKDAHTAAAQMAACAAGTLPQPLLMRICCI